ncbi:MAG: glutamate--tRNA ligase family protein, partial [Verrucomicrobiota bacterium]
EAGEVPAWRMDMAKAGKRVGGLCFREREEGAVVVESGLLGDVVLARKDIGTSYHLAVVVDDAFQGVTDVVRGRDLFESTHVHRVLQELLGLPEPQYWHHRLVRNDEGERLAKRADAESIRALRERGVTREEILRRLNLL